MVLKEICGGLYPDAVLIHQLWTSTLEKRGEMNLQTGRWGGRERDYWVKER
jgi:hypothetical protein